MPSTCPKCHRVLEEDEICCAQVRYTWRCGSCFMLATGAVIPYGKCFMCGGELQMIPNRNVGDGMRFQVIRDAVQFELNMFNFYKLARERARQPGQSVALDWLCETALDRLHELEERYRAHLDREMVERASHEENLVGHWPFEGIRVQEDSEVAEVFQGALEVERRARDHYRELAGEVAAGLENELCRELQAEADEQIAMIETGLEQSA